MKTDALDDWQSDMGGDEQSCRRVCRTNYAYYEGGQLLRYLGLMRETKIQTTNYSGEYPVPSVLIKCSPSSRDGLTHMTKASPCFLDESLWL